MSQKLLVKSGGQTGVDIAAIRAAKSVGIATGGTMPKGFRTQAGPKPEYATLYGMREHPFSPFYPPRTEANVVASDATLSIAKFRNSTGELLTQKYIRTHERLHFEIDPDNPPEFETVVAWLNDNRISILNVAGNSENTAPGIEAWAEAWLTQLFSRWLDSKRF